MTTTPQLWKSQTQVNTTGGQAEGQIAGLLDGGYVVVCSDGSKTYNPSGLAVVGQRYDAFGNKVGGEIKLSGFITGDQFFPAITTLSNGNIAVAFVDLRSGDHDIYVRIFDPSFDLLRVDPIDTDNASQTFYPSITALAGGAYAVSDTLQNSPGDTDVIVRIVSQTGVVGAPFAVESASNVQQLSQMATLSNGNFVVVYEDQDDFVPSQTDISFRIFSPLGVPVTLPKPVFNGADSAFPDVAALRDGGFAVVWTSKSDILTSTTDIFVSTFSNTGTQGSLGQLVNTTTVGNQTDATVVALADGGFLVTWDDDNTNLVNAQRFDSQAHKVGAEFTVKAGVFGFYNDEAGLLADGRIAYALGDASGDVMTSIWTTAPNPIPPIGTTADLILRQSSNGKYEIYDLGNNSILAAYSLGQIGLDWQFAGLGGFNGSDTTDMLLRNSSTGGFEIYDISNNNSTSAAFLGTVGLEWQVMGFGNFSSFGETDMILRNVNNGGVEVYDLRNNQIIGANFIGTVGLDWQVGGFGNFSSRGTSDMILRNTKTGGLEVYDINSNQITGAAFLGTVGLDWKTSGFGNFSSNPGETDMLLRNVNTGGLEVYDISNNQITGAAFLGTIGLDWQFAGVAPIHAPGVSDLVLRNVNSGAFEVYNIANNQITGAAPLGTVGLDWQLGGFAADPTTGSMGGSGDQLGSTAQLVHAMAGFGGGSGAGDSLNTVPIGADTSQQTFLTTPHA
jgi:hypothetical protein